MTKTHRQALRISVTRKRRRAKPEKRNPPKHNVTTLPRQDHGGMTKPYAKNATSN